MKQAKVNQSALNEAKRRELFKRFEADDKGRRMYRNPDDCGNAGKNVEVLVRWYLVPRTRVLEMQVMGRADIVVYDKFTHERYAPEVKTRGGKIWDKLRPPATMTLEEYARSCFPNNTHVIYMPYKWDGYEESLPDSCFVFTRAQWVAYLTGYTSKTGEALPGSMVKINNQDEGLFSVNLQPIEGKGFERREAYMLDTIENLPTLREWKESIKGEE